MANRNFVYSTMSSSTAYAIWGKGGDGEPMIGRQILIKGGANVADPHLITGDGMHTPRGVRTEVTDEELALLEKDYHFQQHVNNGFLTVTKSKVDPEAVVADMEQKDESAPAVPGDFPDGTNGPKPTENKKSK